MRQSLREIIRKRDDFRCCYCRVCESYVGSKLTIDHFMPQCDGGNDTEDNLLYCCHACNEYKGTYWTTEPDSQLLNPRTDNMEEHFNENVKGVLVARTARGKNHIRVLNLNRDELIKNRVIKRHYANLEEKNRAAETYLEDLDQTLQDIVDQIKIELDL